MARYGPFAETTPRGQTGGSMIDVVRFLIICA